MAIPSPRKVSVPLFLGILLVPIIFSWFLLRDGYSRLARALSFTWLIIITFVVTDATEQKYTKTVESVAQNSVTAPPTSISPKVIPASAPQAHAVEKSRVNSIAEDSATLEEIEKRISKNDKSLKTHYGSPSQLEQSQKDIVKLAIFKVEYLDNAKNEKEKALGKKAFTVGKKVEAQARQIYTSMMEEAFIKKGIDARVSALGANREQMRISYVLMSQPMVYKFQNELDLDEKAKSFGFKKLVYSNGIEGDLGKTWTVDLN